MGSDSDSEEQLYCINPKLMNYKLSKESVCLTATSYKEPPLVVSVTQKSTNTQCNATTKTSKKTTNQLTLRKSNGNNNQTSTCFAQVFPARHSVLQENASVSMTRGARSFLKLQDASKLSDLSYCCLRTSKDCSHMTMEEHSEQYSWSWMNWGTIQNGKLLTARITVFPKTGKECSLKDILEEQVHKKYFLSEQAVKGLMKGQSKPQFAGKEDIANTFTAGGHSGGYHSSMTILSVLTPNRLEKRQNGRRFKKDGEPMFTLTGQDIHGVALNKKIRRLTPTECERLQGFPDGHTKMLSDTQRYKCMGNAVSVPVITAIGNKIKEGNCVNKLR